MDNSRPRLQESTVVEFLSRLPSGPPGETWIGDDTAVVARPVGALLLAADSVVAGVHADLSLVGIDDLGWKAVVANVSDMAAMGCRPTHALVTLAGPLGEIDLELLYDGLGAAAERYGCPIVGGDLSAAPTLVVTVAMVGDGGPVPPAPVLRSGARPGDLLFVTGLLGSSGAGLELLRTGSGTDAPELVRAHRRPEARLEEGAAARAAGATAMIDISDGLSTDLGHLADASGVGVVVAHVPVAAGATEALALGGGEDYELLFAVGAADIARIERAFAEAGLRPPLRIGRCTADAAERRLGDGDLPRTGWEHRW
ncbi:MAG: thiamine-phosphate kinase [Acidimicrobiales bacterium]